MSVIADLHVHTTASDGLLSPHDVVRRAVALGLSALAITDHDTLEGIPEALKAAEKEYVEVIPGVEFSSEYDNQEIHILGFYIDHNDARVTGLLAKLHESRFKRAEKMVERLNSLGYGLEWADVMAHAADAAPGRPHVARALVSKGYFTNTTAVFDTLLGYKMPGYVERYKLTPQEAIAAIRKSGGIAAWAHPGLTGNEKLLPDFIRSGLQGLEVYHPDHNPSLTVYYRQLALENRLFICGGSDFHGPDAGHSRDLADFGLCARELKAFRIFREHGPNSL